jgi:ABC-type sugar transport system ATPase subunit
MGLDAYPQGAGRSGKERDVAEEYGSSLSIRFRSMDQPAASLSGGNQQKVVLAKWLETRPRVLLLDEPTRGVDIGAKHDIYELMNRWTQEGIAILLITSEMPELLAMSDRILVLHRGRITGEFTRDQATQERILKAAMGEGDAGGG